MANTETGSSWDQIQRGFRDAERLISEKQNNMAMIKMRQTLEGMIRNLSEKACIVDADLIDMIDELYKSRWITKTSYEHYNKIRIIGNKAVHEGNDDAYNADQAFHMLTQEVRTFATEYNNHRKSGSAPSSRSAGSSSRPAASRSASRPVSSRSSGAPARGSGGVSRNSSNNRSRRRTSGRRRGLTPFDILKLLIPVVLVVLLVFLIKFIIPDKKETIAATTLPEVTTVAPTEPPTTVPATTEPTTEAPVYKTTSNLNVRKEPSKTAEKLGQLTSGTEVEFVEKIDDTWSKIMYNGQEGYVSHEFLTTD